MTDMTSADMARFYERYDRRHRFVFIAALSASLALSAVNFADGAPVGGAHGAKPFGLLWGFGILFPPLAIAAWWGATEFIARWRERRPPTSSDDAPNGVRIANAGFAYSLALTAAVLGSQAVVTLASFGYTVGGWFPRAIGIGVGVTLIWLGNLWPRMPAARIPGRKAATEMKINRVWGWVMVILGLGSVLAGLFLPAVLPWVAHHS